MKSCSWNKDLFFRKEHVFSRLVEVQTRAYFIQSGSTIPEWPEKLQVSRVNTQLVQLEPSIKKKSKKSLKTDISAHSAFKEIFFDFQQSRPCFLDIPILSL